MKTWCKSFVKRIKHNFLIAKNFPQSKKERKKQKLEK